MWVLRLKAKSFLYIGEILIGKRLEAKFLYVDIKIKVEIFVNS